MRCSSFHLRADSATIQSSVKGMVWKKHIVQVTNFAYGPAASQPQNSSQLNTITDIATLMILVYQYTLGNRPSQIYTVLASRICRSTIYNADAF